MNPATPKPKALPVLPDNIPPEMKNISAWIVWGYRWIRGKWAKIPFNPCPQKNGPTWAATDNAGTWATFKQAVEVCRKYPNRFDGIGFMLYDLEDMNIMVNKKKRGMVPALTVPDGVELPDIHFFFIDLDHCRNTETGQLNDMALNVLKMFNSAAYVEVSPSGSGLHIICEGIFQGDNVKTPTIEIYRHLRYLTVTGHRLENPLPEKERG